MNTENETVVTSEMMKKLREAHLSDGYRIVPEKLQAKAMQLLGHNSIADMDVAMKRKLRNMNKQKRRQGVAGY